MCTYGAIREQLGAMHGHRGRYMCLLGIVGCRDGSLSEENTMSDARSRVRRRVRIVKNGITRARAQKWERATPRWPVEKQVCR